MSACRCWDDTYALGHDGHCCFVHGDRKIGNGFREDADICHSPKDSQPLAARVDVRPTHGIDRAYLYCPSGHEVVSASVMTSTGRRLVANDLADESCGYGGCGWAGSR